VGTPTPTREIGFGNTVTLFRNVTLFAQLDYKGGHSVFNYKEYQRCRLAGNCEAVNTREFFAPVTAADSAQQRELALLAGRGVLNGNIINYVEPYVERADFLRLRDLSVTVGIPQRLLARTGASGASVVFAARNVAMLWTRYSGVDPEVNTYGNRSFVRVDAYAAPQNRRLSAAINLNF
jgi:hypothetical protein